MFCTRLKYTTIKQVKGGTALKCYEKQHEATENLLSIEIKIMPSDGRPAKENNIQPHKSWSQKASIHLF